MHSLAIYNVRMVTVFYNLIKKGQNFVFFISLFIEMEKYRGAFNKNKLLVTYLIYKSWKNTSLIKIFMLNIFERKLEKSCFMLKTRKWWAKINFLMSYFKIRPFESKR